MSTFETIEARLELAADGFSSTIDNVTRNLGSLESKAGGAHKAVGALGAGLATAAAGGIAKSVSASMDLQSALTESQAIMGDLTQGEMKQMEDAAREVGRTTTFSAEEAGSSFYYLASAGMDAEQSVASMADVAQFAQAGAFDLATATDLATDAQSALGMSSDDAAENADNLNQVMDVLVKSNTLANASVEEFSQSLTNKAAAAMRQVGMDIEEGSSALAVFADQGLKGNRAGTILARTIEGLQSSAQDNAEAFEELGVSVYDSEGNMRPMADIVEDMDGALEGMSTEQRNAAMEQLGLNERAAQGINLLSGNTDQMREYEDELQNAGGTAEEVANNQLQSLSAQWEIAKSQITDVAISIGNNLLPPLTAMLSFVTDGIAIFQRINEATDGWAGTIGLLATLVTGLTMVAGSLSAVIGAGGLATAVAAASGAVGGLVTAFSILTGPIGLAVAAVSALAYAFYNDFAGIRTQTMRVVEAFRGQFLPVFRHLSDVVTLVLGDLLGAFGGFSSGISARLEPLIAWLADVFIAGIVTVFGRLSTYLFRMETWWALHRDEVIETLQQLAHGVRMAFEILANGIRVTIAAVRAILGPFVEWLSTMWAQHGEEIMSQARETWAVVREQIDRFIVWARPYVAAFAEWLSGAFRTTLDAIQRFWSVWGEDIVSHLRMIVSTIRIAVEGLIDFMSTTIQVGLALIRGDWSEAWELIEGFVGRTVGRIEELVGGWVDVLVGYIKTFVEDGIAWFQELYRKLVGGSIVPDMLDDILAVFDRILDRVLGVIEDFVPDAVGEFATFAKDALSELTSKVSDFKSAGKSLITAVGDGIRDNVSSVKGKVESAAQKIRDYWPSSPAREGPLSDIDKIGPGMMRTIADSISSSEGVATSAAESAAASTRSVLDGMLEAPSVGSGALDDLESAIRGTDRMDNLDAIRSGLITVEDLQSAAGGDNSHMSTAEMLAQEMSNDMQRAGVGGEVTADDLLREAIGSVVEEGVLKFNLGQGNFGEMAARRFGDAVVGMDDGLSVQPEDLQSLVGIHGGIEAGGITPGMEGRLRGVAKEAGQQFLGDITDVAAGLVEAGEISTNYASEYADALRQISEGQLEDWSRSGEGFQPEDAQRMVQAEDGSWVDPSFYDNSDSGPSEVTQEVNVDFGGLPDDAYISVGALKEELAKHMDERESRERNRSVRTY